MAANHSPSFEESLAALEFLVDTLEKRDLPLDAPAETPFERFQRVTTADPSERNLYPIRPMINPKPQLPQTDD